jgi:hypothetical protein
MGKKCSPKAFVGISAGKFFRHGDGDRELFLGGNSPLSSLLVNNKFIRVNKFLSSFSFFIYVIRQYLVLVINIKTSDAT